MSAPDDCPVCGSDNIEEFDGGAVCADCGFEGDDAGTDDGPPDGDFFQCDACDSENLFFSDNGTLCLDCGANA